MDVFEYQAAQQAKETFNRPNKREAFDTLKRHPYLLRILTQMHRAQGGESLSVSQREALDEGMAIADANREPEAGD